MDDIERRRRSVLAAAGTGALAGLGGCLGIFEGGCGPGDTEISELDVADVADAPPETASLKGTVMGHVDRNRLLVSDGTGKARITVPDERIEGDVDVRRGICVAGEVRVDVDRSRWLEVPVAAVPKGETLTAVGKSERNVYPPPNAPDGFDVTATDGGARVRHLGDRGPPANELLVKQRTDGGARRAYWNDLADGVAADERVRKGDAITVDGEGRGTLFWDHADDWKPVIVAWTL